MSVKEHKLITFEEFAEYLGTLDAEHICPMCNSEAWNLSTPNELSPGDSGRKMVTTIPGTYFTKSIDEKRQGLYNTKALDVLLMQCSNCGFVNLFNYRTVEENIVTGNYVKQGDNEEGNG